MRWIARALTVLFLGNGVVMMAAPYPWYLAVPGVIQTGAFNDHFVRDIGAAYLACGAGTLLGALDLRRHAGAVDLVADRLGSAIEVFVDLGTGQRRGRVVGTTRLVDDADHHRRRRLVAWTPVSVGTSARADAPRYERDGRRQTTQTRTHGLPLSAPDPPPRHPSSPTRTPGCRNRFSAGSELLVFAAGPGTGGWMGRFGAQGGTRSRE